MHSSIVYRQTNGLTSLSTDGVAKVQPSTRQSEILPTALMSHAQNSDQEEKNIGSTEVTPYCTTSLIAASSILKIKVFFLAGLTYFYYMYNSCSLN